MLFPLDNRHFITDMLKEAGIGVVMENGSKHAKDSADYIIKDRDSNGIGVFIEVYIAFLSYFERFLRKMI